MLCVPIFCICFRVSITNQSISPLFIMARQCMAHVLLMFYNGKLALVTTWNVLESRRITSYSWRVIMFYVLYFDPVFIFHPTYISPRFIRARQYVWYQQIPLWMFPRDKAPGVFIENGGVNIFLHFRWFVFGFVCYFTRLSWQWCVWYQ